MMAKLRPGSRCGAAGPWARHLCFLTGPRAPLTWYLSHSPWPVGLCEVVMPGRAGGWDTLCSLGRCGTAAWQQRVQNPDPCLTAKVGWVGWSWIPQIGLLRGKGEGD